MTDERISRLWLRRNEAVAKRKVIADRADAEDREHLSEAEDTEFRNLTDEIKTYGERIDELSEEIERGAKITAGAGRGAGRNPAAGWAARAATAIQSI